MIVYLILFLAQSLPIRLFYASHVITLGFEQDSTIWTRRMTTELCLCGRYITDDDDGISDLSTLEQHVLDSARASIDIKRVLSAFGNTDSESKYYESLLFENERISTNFSHLRISVAASATSGAVSYMAWHNQYMTMLVAGSVFAAAYIDDDSLRGALARLVGRTTIKSVEVTQPRVQAVARAVVTGDEELKALRRKVMRLERENQELLQWKKRKLEMDQKIPSFRLDALKSMAREKGLSIKGTKMEIFERLVNVHAINLDELL